MSKEVFKEVDDIVRLGKYLYHKIPRGIRCKGCPLLAQRETVYREGRYCELSPAFSLIHDDGGPLKDNWCPVPKEEEKK